MILMTPEAELVDWKARLQEIFDNVSSLVESRHVFRRLRELLSPNLAITNNIFFDHYVINYAAGIAIGSFMRRMIVQFGAMYIPAKSVTFVTF